MSTVTNDKMYEVAMRIREMRLIAGYTQAQMAEKTETEQSLYIKLEAGEAFMPLSIEKVGDDHIAIYHQYESNGELFADPDMSFWINKDEKELHARSFQQDVFKHQLLQ